VIDLDNLAEAKAKRVGQDPQVWQAAVWTPAFQQLSQSISDGEIEAIIDSSQTVLHFEIITKFLSDSAFSSGITFGELLDKVARSGYELKDWIDSIVEIKHWADQHHKSVTFFEVLIYVNACAIKAGELAAPLHEAIKNELKVNPVGAK
jgi:hypothetical protein